MKKVKIFFRRLFCFHHYLVINPLDGIEIDDGVDFFYHRCTKCKKIELLRGSTKFTYKEWEANGKKEK
jgi:hypothetical protein